MAVNEELMELIKGDARHMKPADLVVKYMGKGYSQADIMDTYREVIYLFMDDDRPEW